MRKPHDEKTLWRKAISLWKERLNVWLQNFMAEANFRGRREENILCGESIFKKKMNRSKIKLIRNQLCTCIEIRHLELHVFSFWNVLSKNTLLNFVSAKIFGKCKLHLHFILSEPPGAAPNSFKSSCGLLSYISTTQLSERGDLRKTDKQLKKFHLPLFPFR